MRVGILNGPNINRLGQRKAQYGTRTLADIIDDVETTASRLAVQIDHFQSNHEGFLVDWLHDHAGELDALILNPAGLTPYGRSLLDAVDDLGVPFAIVHITQHFKHYGMDAVDLFREKADIYVCGLGWRGYSACLQRLTEIEAQ
ncbi:MAG: type II 3-dehydroquinate dehydratase [Micrococcaceae bacterium]